MNTRLISLDRLHDSPLNPNRMPDDRFRTLRYHIARTDRYPAVIVRPHPQRDAHFQIIDGHHRVRALRELARSHARCDIWPIEDDAEADTLLLTLNRLSGNDDPKRRAHLIARLRDRSGLDAVLARLPDSQERIRSLLRLRETVRLPQPKQPATRPTPQLRLPLTVFLTRDIHQQVMARLRELHTDRARALLIALGLDEARPEQENHDAR